MMNRVQVARAAFAVSASSALLAIVLLGAGPFEDPSQPSALPPWAIEPSRGRDGRPQFQAPLATDQAADQIVNFRNARSASLAPWPLPQPAPSLSLPRPQPLSKAGD